MTFLSNPLIATLLSGIPNINTVLPTSPLLTPPVLDPVVQAKIQQLSALPSHTHSAYMQGFLAERARQANPNVVKANEDEEVPGHDEEEPSSDEGGEASPEGGGSSGVNKMLIPMVIGLVIGLMSKNKEGGGEDVNERKARNAKFKKETNSELTAKQQKAIDAINEVRAKHGKGPIKGDPKLCQAAEGQSDKMADEKDLKHANLGEYNLEVCCENIANGNTSPEATVKQWEDSPGHLANILSLPDGATVGVAPDSMGGNYWTMIGSRRKGSDGLDPSNIA